MSTLQNNVIERNMRAGVVVTDTANPTLAVNIIRDGKHAGLLVRHKAKARGQYRQVMLPAQAGGRAMDAAGYPASCSPRGIPAAAR